MMDAGATLVRDKRGLELQLVIEMPSYTDLHSSVEKCWETVRRMNDNLYNKGDELRSIVQDALDVIFCRALINNEVAGFWLARIADIEHVHL
jgi:hypothetical protein